MNSPEGLCLTTLYLSFPTYPLTRLMSKPRSRERDYVARVLLVAEEEPALAEGGPTQGEGQHFPELLNQEHLDAVPNFPGQILEIRFVLLRQDDPADARPNRAEHLLLHSADREHPSAQGNLTSHGDVMPDRPAREGRHYRRCHRHPCRRPILRNRSGGNVNVDVQIEPVIRNMQRGRMRPGVGPRRPSALLHHVTQLSGEHQLALASHRRGFHEHDVTTGWRVVHTGCNADLVLPCHLLRMNLGPAEQIVDHLAVDGDLFHLLCSDLPGHFPG